MLNADAAWKTYIADPNNKKRLAHALRLQARDGTVVTVTDFNRDIPLDVGFGSEVYKSAIGFGTASAVQRSIDFQPDTLDISGAFKSSGITRQQVVNGFWKNARFWLVRYRWDNLTFAPIKIMAGTIADISYDETFEMFLNSHKDKLENLVGDTLPLDCPYDFMVPSTRVRSCGVVGNPPVWAAATGYFAGPRDAKLRSVVKSANASNKYVWLEAQTTGTSGGTEPTWPAVDTTVVDGGVTWKGRHARVISVTITGVTDNLTITVDYAGGADNSFFPGGEVSFTSGVLSSFTEQIETMDTGTGVITFQIPLPQLPSIGDTLDLRAGCDHLIGGGCLLFENTYNYGGAKNQPGNRQVLDVQS